MCREVLLHLFLETRFADYLMYIRWEFHALMKLCNTECFLEFVLVLGTVKRPLVACLVGLVCVSELYVS